MPTRTGTPEYEAALDAMTVILTAKASEGVLINYEKVSIALKGQGHTVHHRGELIGQLLKDLCLQEAKKGAPMLSAIVVNAPITRGRPSQAFYDLARSYPFNRDADWTWEQERDRVFTYYSQEKRPI
ncbi:hypothetical protein ACFWVC_11375 [Streptomyces sp. NPDC058691]|uniref:hypothetical protein n=1 Tax=Streptomyces sp. NPDC058691 TaxID=3346601 RepID=UPI00364FF178